MGLGVCRTRERLGKAGHSHEEAQTGVTHHPAPGATGLGAVPPAKDTGGASFPAGEKISTGVTA